MKNNIAQARKEKNLSQRKLAEMAGIDYSGLCRVEKGKVGISAEKLKKIADALEVSTDYLLGRNGYFFYPSVELKTNTQDDLKDT